MIPLKKHQAMVDYLAPHHYAMDSMKNVQRKMELFIAGRSFCAWSLATSLELISLLIFIFCIIYRQRRSQRYTKDFVEAVLDNDPNFDSDDDIMGEAVYDEEYLKSRRQQKTRSFEDNKEFRLEQFASDGDVEVGHSLNANDDALELQWSKRLPIRNPQGNNLRFIDEIRIGIRRSKRSTRSRINYQQYDISGRDTECGQPEKQKMQGPDRESRNIRRKFLDLNELAPVAGFDDKPALVKDER
jgi:hypothetical protein